MNVRPLHPFRRARIVATLLCVIAVVASGAAAAQSEASAKPEPKPKRTASAAVRTLDAITIEGEIAVPQVLFITAREHPRYRDGLGERYAKSALQLATCTVLPARVRVMEPPENE